MQIKASSLPLLVRFTSILASLVTALGVRMQHRALDVGIGEGVRRRVQRTRSVVEALVLRLVGRLLAGRAKRVVARAVSVERRREVRAETRARLTATAQGWASMPRRFGWLCPLLMCTDRFWESAAQHGADLARVLEDPQFRRWMALEPRIAQALAPLCRMLHVDPALLVVGEPTDPEAEAAEVVALAPLSVEVAPPAAEPIIAWWQQKWAQ